MVTVSLAAVLPFGSPRLPVRRRVPGPDRSGAATPPKSASDSVGQWAQ